jgi:hypothetical protein
MNWKTYFEMMADWKRLPAYKAEPRIDSLVGFFLPQFIAEYLGIEVVGIIPELPIRLATVKPKHEGTNYADRSYKVDFLIVATNGKNYLVEFKTDSGSRRDAQDMYLEEAKSAGTKAIIEGVLQIASVSSYKKKYDHLTTKLKSVGLLNNEKHYSELNPSFEIIYVQPSNPKSEELIIDFAWISNWLEEKYPDSEFETEFAKALKLWAED